MINDIPMRAGENPGAKRRRTSLDGTFVRNQDPETDRERGLAAELALKDILDNIRFA